MHYSVNEMAVRIVEEKILPHMDALGVSLHTLSNGAKVIDMGVHAKGGWMSAKYFTEADLGGLGELHYRTMMVGRHLVPTASIRVDRPGVAELGCHDAFLLAQHMGRTVTVSGPIRTIVGTDKYVNCLSYRDSDAVKTVAAIQTDILPNEDTAESIAEKAHVRPESMYILAAKTATLTGAAQVCARNVEQVLPSLLDRGFDMETIVYASGTAPIPSVVDDETLAMGRVNDGLIYGQETNLYVRCEDEAIESILPELPFNKNQDIFGIPFFDLFAQCGNDWAKVPRKWDAPCKVNFFNMKTNRIFVAGEFHYGVLEKSFLGI